MFGKPPWLFFVLDGGPWPLSVWLTEFYWLARVCDRWLEEGSWQYLGVVRELAQGGKRGCDIYLREARAWRDSHYRRQAELTLLLEQGLKELEESGGDVVEELGSFGRVVRCMLRDGYHDDDAAGDELRGGGFATGQHCIQLQ